jgi:hypothetical protein
MDVGEIWIDKDKRMKGRAVKIVELGPKEAWVRYSPCNPTSGWVSQLKYRSRGERFVKAFSPHK